MAAIAVGRLRTSSNIFWLLRSQVAFSHGGELGSGSGKGGGTGGTVREAGGSMGKKGAVQEEEFFMRMERQQLDLLKHAKEEIEHHEESIKDLKKSIKHYKEKLKDIEKEQKKLD
ncbi:ATPase inhibitor mai-1, mitochondrial-like [Centruroides vittatus]|uniref:ATPase inhibitor mai-1, mitochondrial-like n=1 Tax=Centruroides vittatus TaxID=120091 RepID=UPI003510C82E